MWEEIYKTCGVFIAFVLTGFVIKLMDDFLDYNFDILVGKPNLSHGMGKGVLPYTLLLFSGAVLIEKDYSISLFLAAYGIGMLKDMEKLPTGLLSWQETMIVVFIGLLVFKKKFIFASLGILLIQLLDDVFDYKYDKMVGGRNFAVRFGITETTLAAFIIFAFIAKCFLVQTVLLIGAYGLISILNHYLSHYFQKKGRGI